MPRSSTPRRRAVSHNLRLSVFAFCCLFAILCAGAIASTVTQAQSAPANDNFADAIDLEGALAGSLTANNVGATAEENEPSPEDYTSSGVSVWYKWTAPINGRATFDTLTTTEGYVDDTKLAVYTGASITELTSVVANDDAYVAGFPDYQSRVRFSTTAGTTYYFQVDGYSEFNIGDIALNWQVTERVAVAHDNFADALVLDSATSGSVTGFDNTDATAETGEPDHDDDHAVHSIWFKWTAPADFPANTDMRFNTYGSGFDSVMGVYGGSSLQDLEEIASDDDGDFETDGESETVFAVVPGATYYIAVDSYNGSDEHTGTITLNWLLGRTHVRPANDNFADAALLEGASGSLTGTTFDATREPNEPRHGAAEGEYEENLSPYTIWYKWTATESGTHAFDTLQTLPGEFVSTRLAVYTGNAIDSLNLIVANDNADTDLAGGDADGKSLAYFNATEGTTYYVAVVTDQETDGIVLNHAAITIPVPANDDFVNAEFLGASGSLQATVKFASAEAGEPEHANEAAINSVWYRYVAGSDGGTFFKASSAIAGNSFFSPRVAIYTGDSLGNLTLVKSRGADAFPGFSGTVSVGFQATSGTTYYVAVDGQQASSNGFSYTNTVGKFLLSYGADSIAPTSVTAALPTATNGFYRFFIGFNLIANDGQNGSGVAGITYSAAGAQTVARRTVANTFAFLTVTTEGATTFTYFATDNAGNVEAEKTFTVNIDRTAPATTAIVLGTQGANGFYLSDATISLNAADSFSGANSITYAVNGGAPTTVAGASAAVPVTTDGTTTITYFAKDRAGNTEAIKTLMVKLDKTLPSVTINSPVEGASFALGAAVKAAYSCADAGSGLATCTGTTPAGADIDTASVGAKTFSVTATDAAGNTATRTVNYTVGYAVRALFNTATPYNSGATVPVKLMLADAAGANLSRANLTLTALYLTRQGSTTQLPAAAPGNSHPGNAFKFDATSNAYTFNLKTDKGLAAGTYLLHFRVAGDPTVYFVPFTVR